MAEQWAMPDLASQPRAVWHRKRGAIACLPASVTDDELREWMTLRETGRLLVCYAPLDYSRQAAPIAVVGLTPGMHTFRASVMDARETLRAGASDDVALRRAKATAPFSNPQTRRKLLGWLDDLGVARHLGLASCSELYERRGAGFVHWTSLIRYPTFRWHAKEARWKNYSGQPDPLSHVGDIIHGAFIPEIRRLQAQAIFLCGKAVGGACDRLVQQEHLDGARLVRLPHPSPESRGADDDYAARRRELRQQVRACFGHQSLV